MDNFGGEIGQKMRSAVKAKLIELGTGAAGYIDDELPDYVMIMVANKRSKQQMITDLNLFLGEQTELFVTWLHEVLQKLQEVTLPAVVNIATNKKRKAHPTKESHSKKDKKAAKKDKRSAKHAEEAADNSSLESERPTTTTDTERNATVPVINSITDVFAEELLEKAKKTLDVNTNAKLEIKKSKSKKSNSTTTTTNDATQKSKPTNEFDIPTISEISSTTGGVSVSKEADASAAGSGNREKDLEELAEIQRKIYAAKKHLKARGQLPIDEDDVDDNDSLDKDYLNLKDDACVEFSDDNTEMATEAQNTSKSPIVFDVPEQQRQPHNPDETKQQEALGNSNAIITPLTPPHQSLIVNNTDVEEDNSKNYSLPRNREHERERRSDVQHDETKKRPVHERLGLKTRAERMRQDKELYVPAHRRRELDNSNNHDRDRSRVRERTQDRSRERLQERQSRDRERHTSRGRDRRRDDTRQRRNQTPERRSISSTAVETRRIMTPKRRSATPDMQPNHFPATDTRKRVGSRVIVAPAKIIEPSDDEDLNDKPVNSVIKIKPRQPVSPSKQACKKLLLRAVADAQRSTILAKTPKEKKPASLRLGEIVANKERNTKLYTKSYRDRLKQSGAGELFRRTTKNLIIEVETANGNKPKRQSDTRMQRNDQEYVPDSESESDVEYAFVPQTLKKHANNTAQSYDEAEVDEESEYEYVEIAEKKTTVEDTQFVVTLNDGKAHTKYSKHMLVSRSSSASPLPQVTSSSSTTHYKGTEATSTSARAPRNLDSKRRLSLKEKSVKTLKRLVEECDSAASSQHSNTPPIHSSRRSELIEIYRKPKEIKKIIIKPDTDEDEEISPKLSKMKNVLKCVMEPKRPATPDDAETLNNKHAQEDEEMEERSLTPPLPPHAIIRSSTATTTLTTTPTSATKDAKDTKSGILSTKLSTREHTLSSSQKRKHVPIKYDLDKATENKSKHSDNTTPPKKSRRSHSLERNDSPINDRKRDSSAERLEEHRKINTRNLEDRKYDNIPSLSSVPVDTSGLKVFKPKERCIYHPNCTKNVCEYYHPSAPCKAFPNCKYGDKCMYTHPKCKYDMSCMNNECSFMHSGQRNISTVAPPLSSHVVPVQTYKSISAVTAPTTAAVMCKYYPNCTKVGCTFYHPKPCRFGKNCINKLECNFYHHEVQSCNKFKWVAQTG